MRATTRATLTILTACMAAIVIGGMWFFQSQKQHLQATAEHELTTITRLKVDQIAKWRAERLADAAVVAEDPFLVEGAHRYLDDPTEETRRPLFERFESLKRNYRLHDVLLIDGTGKPQLSLSGKLESAGPADHQTIFGKIDLEQLQIGPLHEGPAGLPAHIDMIAPVWVDHRGARNLIGAIVLQCDARAVFFPLIQSWPTGSQTAETLLVRRDGDEVLFLNELRHKKGTALKLRIPMSREDLPAVMAVEGQTGLVTGRDYRGVEVLAVLAHVPDSDWYMVAKVDTDEALAVWRTRAALILGAIIGLLSIALAGMVLTWQRDAKTRLEATLAAKQLQAETERKFQAAFDQASIGRTLTRPDGRLDRVNRTLCEMLGYSPADLERMPFTEITHPDDLAASKECVRCLLAGEQDSYHLEKRYLHKDGRVVWTNMSATLVRDEAGEPQYFFTDIVDISAQKRAQQAREASEARMRTTLYSIGDAVITTDRDGRVEVMNAVAEGLTGWTEADAKGKPLGEVFPIVNEDSREALENPVERVLREGEVVGLANHTLLIAKDGTERPIADSGAPIHDAQGDITGVVLVFRDQTEERAAGRALSQSERRYRELFERATVGIFKTTSEGRVIAINPAMAKMLGFDTPEQAQEYYTDLGTQLYADPAQRAEFIRLISEKGEVRDFEYSAKLRDGRSIVLSMNARIADRHADGSFAIEGFTTDITDRLEAEADREALEEQLRVSQRMEAIGQLAGGVAHDFNNLLSVIMSYTTFSLEALREGDPVRADLEEVHKAAKQAASLTRQLLAFSRRQVLEPVVLNFNDVITDMEKMLERLIGEDIEFAVLTDAGLGNAEADRGQLEQVIMNLAVNARDAMPDGGKLTIETRNVALDQDYADEHSEVAPGDYVMLSVSDSGCGMDAATRKRVFEPFFSTKGKGKGTGLGLSTVYGIVKQSGGHVWVYSELEAGTTFKVYLPKVDAPIVDQAQAGAAEQLTGDETVLVVEDEDAVRKMAVRLLEAAGYTVLSAANGGEALLACEKTSEAIDLLVTDVIMPKMSGKELADRIAKIRPGLRVLYMSGYTDNAIVHHGVLDPGTKFIGKPFSAVEFTRKVREVLDEGTDG